MYDQEGVCTENAAHESGAVVAELEGKVRGARGEEGAVGDEDEGVEVLETASEEEHGRREEKHDICAWIYAVE